MKQYNPALDGLRAVAVLAVMCSHTCGLFAGFIGVDIFFVLSGFLITSVLIRDREEDRGLGYFYIRRFLRIVPALAALCLALLLLKPFLDEPQDVKWDILSTLSYVSNWTKVAGFSVPHYIGHTWSLSIEEQYYLIWPVLFLGLLKWRGAKTAGAVTFALAAASGLWRLYLEYHGASIFRIFYSFDGHCDGLLIGSGLAVCRLQPFWPKMESAANKFCLIPVLFLLTALATTSTDWMARGGWTLINLAAATIITAACRRDGRLFRALSFPPLVAVGKMSYSLYLWHYIVFMLMLEKGVLDSAHLPQFFLSSFALAAASYWLVERPFVSFGHRVPHRLTASGRYIAFASAYVFVLGIGTLFASYAR